MKVVCLIITLLCLIGGARLQTTISVQKHNDAVDFYNNARKDFTKKDYRSASINFRRALELAPKKAEYSYGLASSYYELQKYDSAIKYINLTIVLKPNQSDYHNMAGNIFFHNKNYKKAIKNYSSSISYIKDSVSFSINNSMYNIAVSKYYLKDYDGAIETLSQLIKKAPAVSNYIYFRGVSYLKLKQTNNACGDLKKAYSMGYSGAIKYLAKYCK